MKFLILYYVKKALFEMGKVSIISGQEDLVIPLSQQNVCHSFLTEINEFFKYSEFVFK